MLLFGYLISLFKVNSLRYRNVILNFKSMLIYLIFSVLIINVENLGYFNMYLLIRYNLKYMLIFLKIIFVSVFCNIYLVDLE